MPKRAAPSYQEATVVWLPVSPYVSWPLLCLALLAAIISVLREQLFPAIEPESVERLLAFFVLSYLAIVYEIVGIILGQRRSKRLEALLPQLLGFYYHHPPFTLDQRCLPPWHTMLPWEQRLRRVWRCRVILIVAMAGGVIGVALGYTYFAIATGNYRVGIALAVWLGVGGFWGAPALYHLSSVSWFIYRLSRQAEKTIFMTLTTSGMSWVARLAFEYLLLYSGAAALWTLAALISVGPGRATVLFAGVMSLFALIGFVLPQLSIRAAMVRRKREMLDEILTRIQSSSAASITTPAPELSRLMVLYSFVSAVPSSGMFGAVAKFVATSLLPLSLALLRAAGESFPDSTSLQVVVRYLR